LLTLLLSVPLRRVLVLLLRFVAATTTSALTAAPWVLRLLAVESVAVVVRLLILWSELLLLVLLTAAVEVFVLEVANLEEFNKATANIVFVSLLVRLLRIFCRLEGHDGLASAAAIGVLPNLNGVFNHAEPVEELLNVVIRGRKWQTVHFQTSFLETARLALLRRRPHVEVAHRFWGLGLHFIE
jgi:hypothetical protein